MFAAKTLFRSALVAAGLLLPALAHADPLPLASIPEVLRSWLPWALQEHKDIGCPQAGNGGERVCVWPTALELVVTSEHGLFKLDVQVIANKSFVQLPGSVESWPQGVKLASGSAAGNSVIPVVQREGKPFVELMPGQYTLSGEFSWLQRPQELLVPTNVATVTVKINGADTRLAPDSSGRLILREQQAAVAGQGSDSIRVSRLIDDGVPMRMVTHLDIAFSGKPSELTVAAIVPEGFVAESIISDLAAKIDGSKLVIQARPGSWTVDVQARTTQVVNRIQLPTAVDRDEVWAFSGHGNLRLATVEGVPVLDAKQVSIPDDWRQFPVYRVRAGDTFTLAEKYRGNANPPADKLSLNKELWLDFSGEQLTARDHFTGQVSKSWRIETQPGVQLGRVASAGIDQPVTRIDNRSNPGFELRDAVANVTADSRLPWLQSMPASGWAIDLNALHASLHLPPGWRLVYAMGPDSSAGSWAAQWTLWDFFFVLMTALACSKLLGRRIGLIFLAGLVLSWHAAAAPHFAWLAVLACHALQKVLPAGKLSRTAQIGKWLSLAAVVIVLVPFAVQQIRFAMYPDLELPWQPLANESLGSVTPEQGPAGFAAAPPAVPAPASEAPAAAADEAVDVDGAASVRSLAEPMQDAATSLRSAAGNSPSRLGKAAQKAERPRQYDVDPSAKIPTGPGIPTWSWNRAQLDWAGPVTREQTLTLFMLSPAAHALLRLTTLLLLVLMAYAVAGRPGRGTRGGAGGQRAEFPAQTGASAAVALLLAIGLAGQPTQAEASAPVASTAVAIAGDGSVAPSPALLGQMVEKLTAAPDCQPQCAEVARMVISGSDARLTATLEVHALGDLYIPLPVTSQDWRIRSVVSDGKAAIARRDDAGHLFVALSRGVHQVIIDGDVGTSGNLSLGLPIPVHAVANQATGWTLSGLDARGIPGNALVLSRVSTSRSGESNLASRDSFPPLVRIERTLRLGLKWQVETRISRISASQAPVMAHILLLPGESVLDPMAKVVDGVAQIQLGDNANVTMVSALIEQPVIKLASSKAPNQVEVWKLDVSPQWHVKLSGIPSILDQSAPSSPTWMPWPGEEVSIAIRRPASIEGAATITADRSSLIVTPGQRESTVALEMVLRTSQAENHRFTLPEGAVLGSVTIDGIAQIVQPQGAEVTAAVPPGTHLVKLEWREPRGMQTLYRIQHLASKLSGSNLFSTLRVPHDRIVLAVGGDGYGPAVLFWGVVVVILALAYGLARTRLTPLGFVAWALLGIGLAQSSLLGAIVVCGLFFVLHTRQRFGMRLMGGRFNAMQIGLALWALIAAAVLLSAIQSGLLGFPDLLIEGNGSSAFDLHWYLDRADSAPASAWVLSCPVWLYRGAMLLWALWLAASLIKWIKWGWSCAVDGGYWQKSLPKRAAKIVVDEMGK